MTQKRIEPPEKQVGRPNKEKVEARNFVDMLDRTAIVQVGTAIAGSHWQADVAKRTRYSKSAITRFLNVNQKGGRTPDDIFSEALRLALIDNLEEIADAFQVTGLPHADNPKTTRVVKKIKEAVGILREKM